MYTAVCRPLSVIVIFHTFRITVPGVKNKLNIALININTTIAFRPLTINLNGTFDNFITAIKAIVATRYTHIFIPKNRDIINTNVPNSFTLGSKLCIFDSA